MDTIKYCELDCISLYQVLETFGKLIFTEFKINIDSISTLPSLAFKIFRTHYMPLPSEVKIPVLSGKMYNDISNAYYGGHVDMYIPSNPEGEKVYHYDVNSLYPFAMNEYKYPTELIAYFRGDITLMQKYSDIFKNNLSVLKVKVTAPDNIKHPLLPYKIDNTTIYPTGSWVGWYYSEELVNALKYGYQYEILEGYIFKGYDIFSKYIKRMYEIKEKSDSNSGMYLISKLLMNSLYGRFGMKPSIVQHKIVTEKELTKELEYIRLENLVDQVKYGDKYLLSYWEEFPLKASINVSVASAITANARICMSLYKNREDYELYYSDTDSYFLNKPLPDNLVDNKQLGKFKLEKVLTKLVALGPKVYGGIDTSGKEFVKVKGFKKSISLNNLEQLLNKDNVLTLNQEKWFKKIIDSTIIVKESNYNLTTTFNKRLPIYQGNKLVGTQNIKI